MKRGFTLVELLAVLVVLGLLSLVVMPIVINYINSSSNSAYKKQIQVLESAAEKWGIENIDSLPDSTSGESLIIDFNTLYTAGQISSYPVIDPKTKKELEGCILVIYNNQYKQYEYKYTSDSSKCNN